MLYAPTPIASSLVSLRCFFSVATCFCRALNCAGVGPAALACDAGTANTATANANASTRLIHFLLESNATSHERSRCRRNFHPRAQIASRPVTLLRLPEPYDFELSTARYRSWGRDL